MSEKQTDGVPGKDMAAVLEKLRQEIAERKRTESALRESQEQLREAQDIARIGRWEMDLTTNHLSWSDGIYKIFEIDPEKFKTSYKAFLEAVHPADRDTVNTAYMESVKNRTPYDISHRLLMKDGRVKWVNEICRTDYDAEGRPLCSVGIVQDVTEQKRAEEALRESERRFRELAELLPESIFEMDKKGKLSFVNRNAFEQFGYTQQDLDRGLNGFDMIVPEQKERAVHNARRVMRGEDIGLNEYTARAKDGRTFPVLFRSTAVIQDGQAVGLRGFIIDIKERKKMEAETKRLEAQLQQAQKMEAVGTLAGGIAHDFNNLLMGIQGRTSLMMLDIDASHPHFEHLKGIEEYVRSASDLTKQLLGFARGGKYEVRPTDINTILRRSSDMFGRTKKEITIHTKCQENLWPVEADQRQIEQVLLNLYVNAWHAMPGGGEFFLETQNVELQEKEAESYHLKPGRYVKISVADSGVGMDEATRQRIFDPFFTTKEMGRGTGLGLASAYGIIQNHNGIIRVYSEKGSGTTFHIHLPASSREVGMDKKPEEEILKGSETILLVDDEEMILEVGKSMIEKLGYRVLTVKNGRDALRIYENHQDPIDMVIVDMIMPDMGGGETYDRLREMNPDIKVLLSSGYSINGRAQDIIKRGCDGFIQKPFDLRELSQRIRRILDKK